MLPGALLFDLDDTLVVFSGVTRPAWLKTCARFAPRTGLPADDLYERIRAHAQDYWSDPDRHRRGRLDLEQKRRELVAETLERAGKNDRRLAVELADHYSALQESLIDFFPDAEDTLNHLKDRGVRMALVTNGNAKMQRRKIDRFRLDHWFGHFFVEGELGYGKPDPRVFRSALAALRADPAETWCVGDNLEWDVGGAQACGIRGIWKDTYRKGLRNSPVTPDRVILELAELIEE
jgi:HAD superfamily hydrolase (TIGR01549 family)